MDQVRHLPGLTYGLVKVARVVGTGGADPTLTMSIPFKYRTQTYQLLVESTDISPPLDRRALSVSPESPWPWCSDAP